MTRVSKRELQPQHLKKLYIQLAKTVAQLDYNASSIFLDELLGKEEKIMIAKRFAVIVMLIEGNSSYRIAQLLHMSPSTIERLKDAYKRGTYSNLEEVILRDKNAYKEFWQTLETILRAGLPPVNRGRWKSIFDSFQEK